VEELIRQIRLAASQGLFYLALYGALTLPDLCGALGSGNGRASGSKYKNWVRENVANHAERAEELYGLRCSLMHQGHTLAKGSVSPVAFTAPGTGQVHGITTVVGDDRVTWISVELLVAEITEAAEKWLAKYGGTGTVQRNVEKFARFRPEGLPPHAEGPVIA
jgi:hypothetical protein